MRWSGRVWVLVTIGAVLATAFATVVILRATEFPGDPNWLRVEVATHREHYAVGEPVHMVATLFNPGNRLVVLEFGSLCHSHFHVFEENTTDGRLVAVADTTPPACALEESSLAIEPGGKVELTHAWDQLDYSGEAAEPGVYIAQVHVTSRVQFIAIAVFSIQDA